MNNISKNTKGMVLPAYLSEDALLKYQYKGCLGKHNKPNFPSETSVFQSLFGIVHFHLPLN
jgi:hypothetical protein